MEKQKVYAFDFDGTLTTKDTLPLFIAFARGRFFLIVSMVLFLPLFVLMKLHVVANWRVKQWLFSWCFKGMSIKRFNVLCEAFAQMHQCLLRKDGMECLDCAIKNGDKVFVVSASIENWIEPFFYGRSVVVCGTQIEVVNGKLTGRFGTKNCYGQEKVRRIRTALPDRETYTLVAFGDSRGDRELLAFADESYYKMFNEM